MTITDEQLTEIEHRRWQRTPTEDKETIDALMQEVRRLREMQLTWETGLALVEEQRNKAEAAFRQAVVDSTQMRVDLERTEAELREAISERRNAEQMAREYKTEIARLRKP